METHNTPPAADPFAGWTPGQASCGPAQPLTTITERETAMNQQYKQHQPGSMVEVYQNPMQPDPQNPKRFEGRAEVIRREPEYAYADPGWGWYLVCFNGEPGSDAVYRLLEEPEIKPAR